MTKIKLCGLSRPCDIDFVNAVQPDFCGFVIDVPKSRRNVTPEQVRALCARLAPSIKAVGVFVNAPPEEVAALLETHATAAAQLHGQEDDAYIRSLRRLTDAPIIQAFHAASPADIERANHSIADCILLDHGAGGTGCTFDWSLTDRVTRPYILAGGLTPENLPRAIERCHPFAVDLSSGVETNGCKDLNKMRAAVAAVRRGNHA
ncbi:MAG: phosphoribosylanthranilate isomerase [Butyricicoccus sp.]|nr:phosphoribosylanthranilate isomerase [Butyricicoccus sp.]